jgi:hypothetical protein
LSEHDILAERTPSVRFARNLALSISGGALATLLGANAAHAQDAGTAAAESTGTGNVTTGDATATGNQSNTNTTQTITVSGNLGVIQVINQQANVSNIGVGVANTGGNVAVGNSSDNTATANQTADGGDTGGAANNGTARNVSDGTADINTGAATAVGNKSETNVVQEAHGSAHGQLGGILVINQEANVINAGAALANTGGNFAFANDSENTAGLLQDANADGGSLANNNGAATNDSNGKATINTGPASAIGNQSNTNVTQKATGDAGGKLGGLMVINQDTDVINAGAALANTGANFGWGNTSDNTADVAGPVDQLLNPNGAQQATASGTPLDQIGIASNNGEASNGSGGSATITTGPATAVGNNSTTKVTQTATGKIDGPFGGGIVNQDSDVINAGFALANSGFNFATGNDSENHALTLQEADGSGFSDVGVVGNFGMAANTSDGTAGINSGVAKAAGNQSTTDVGQTADIQGGNFALQTQGNDVWNLGAGVANSGVNFATGNHAFGDAGVDQEAHLTPAPAGPDLDVGVIGQFGLAANDSDGTATITTGAATAVGNDSLTNVTQTADPTATTIQVQQANVINGGFGFANSGGNFGIGNDSSSFELPPDDGEENPDLDGIGVPMSSVQGIGIPGVGDFGLSDALPSLGPIGDALDEHFYPGAADDGEDLARHALWAFKHAIPDEIGDGLHDAFHQVHDALGSLYDTLNNPFGALPAAPGPLGDLIHDDPLETLLGFGEDARDGLRDPVFLSGDATPAGDDTGIASTDDAGLTQTGSIDIDDDATVGTLTLSNDGEASNTSDGTATITTGTAVGNGNVSTTSIDQGTNAAGDGLGLALSVQNAGVINVGIGIGNSGGNEAHGNWSDNTATLGEQASDVHVTDDLTAGVVTAHNGASVTNDSDGTATITTGAASGTGNHSGSVVKQTTDAEVDGLGVIVHPQTATVDNVGIGVGDSGRNYAIGNDSTSLAFNDGLRAEVLIGNDANDDLTVGTLTAATAGEAANTSDGTATITSGAADGVGNLSETQLNQTADAAIDGAGLVVEPQTAAVRNLGVGVGLTGDNTAIGNQSDGFAGFAGRSTIDGDGSLVAGTLTVANSAQGENNSDGTATITTGAAKGEGNNSTTKVAQIDPATITDDALGSIVQVQNADVTNAGVGVANSGDNGAIGNQSMPYARAVADSTASFDGTPLGGNLIGTGTVANSGSSTNATDGTATITTGAAGARGNLSNTNLLQDADASVDKDGLGTLVGVQNATVDNEGAALANTGGNGAVGVAHLGDVDDAVAETDTNHEVHFDGPATVGTFTLANTVDASNASNGTATITTGTADASGNSSATDLGQHLDGAVLGMGVAVQPQTATVTNQGIGVANSGVNGAIGNLSQSRADATDVAGVVEFGDDATFGTFTSAHSATASNATDGKATINTGAATGKGNVSNTKLAQTAGADIADPGLGLLVAPQTATVTNQGIGIGNTGINGAIGNLSGGVPLDDNDAFVHQDNDVIFDADVTAGVFTVANTASATNESNGTASITTGKADGVGNNSTTDLGQKVAGTISDLGLAVVPQTATVTNGGLGGDDDTLGLGVANSGINGAIGNASGNDADAEQNVEINNHPLALTLTGPGTIAQNGHAANESDGTATIKTGDASGVGNNSATTLGQEIAVDPGDGFAVVPMTAEVTNQGIGVGNSGINGAIGNISGNIATSFQELGLDPGVGGVDPVGLQTLTNTGGAENRSNGAGSVGTGKAAGAGNVSSTGLGQKVAVDGPGAIAPISATTTNEGLGIANSGINLGLGNASQNLAQLRQEASGAGLVTNSGVAGNGTTVPGNQVPPPGGPGGPGGPGNPGNPVPPDVANPMPEAPGGNNPGNNPDATGRPALPVMGTEAAAEAIIGALLILAGFGFRRAGKRLS